MRLIIVGDFALRGSCGFIQKRGKQLIIKVIPPTIYRAGKSCQEEIGEKREESDREEWKVI